MIGRARLGAWLGLVLAIVVLQTPRIAQACAVCTAGRDEENQLAFLLSTIFMSLLPLIAIGSLVFFLWRRLKKLEEEREQAEATLGAPGAPIAPSSAAPIVPR